MSGDEKKISANQEIQKEIAIVDERTIRDKIYVVRGQKVMLDFELAEIYGFSTSAFNQQVKRNIERFDEDFRFQLTREEVTELSISQNVTSIQLKGIKGGRSKLPWAFTEAGIYMLMTVLKGDLAVHQSKTLIRVLQALKDYVVETQGIVMQRDILRLSMQTAENAAAIQNVHTMVAEQQKLINDQQKMLLEHDDKLIDAYERINETVKKSDLSPVFLQFQQEEQTEFLLLNGHPVQADLTYMDIYSKAQKSVYIIDDYISLKTLNLLQTVKPGVTVTVFSDNQYNKLHASDYADFQTEFPTIQIQLITTGGTVHDRYIILDYDEASERIFLCGSSSKDSGVKKMSTIVELESPGIGKLLHGVVDQLKQNPALIPK